MLDPEKYLPPVLVLPVSSEGTSAKVKVASAPDSSHQTMATLSGSVTRSERGSG